MDNTLFSVIVPVYGVENYIRKCVDSIINQSYKNIEIILVDDGSNDNCPRICDEYAETDSRVKVIHKKNGGLVSARKTGAKEAKGEYIICVDGDDWIPPEYILTFNNIVVTYHPDLICCGLVSSNEYQQTYIKIQLEPGYYDQKKIVDNIYPIAIERKDGKIFPPQLCSKAIKRELYINEQLAVSDKICIGEDGAVTKSLITKCKSLYIIEKCLYYYRYNNSSLTKRKEGYNWAGPKMIYEHLRERIINNTYDFSEQIDRKIAHDIYIVIVSHLQTDKPYLIIKKDIEENIKRFHYRDYLSKGKFSSVKIILELFLIRNHIYYPIYILKKFSNLYKKRTNK